MIFLENDIWAIIKQEPMFEKKLVKGLLTACRLTIGLWGQEKLINLSWINCSITRNKNNKSRIKRNLKQEKFQDKPNYTIPISLAKP